MEKFWVKLEDYITNLEPKHRRRLAIKLLFWSAVATPINVALYMLGFISIAIVGLITLALSWLALTVTFADIVASTDIRVEVGNEG